MTKWICVFYFVLVISLGSGFCTPRPSTKTPSLRISWSSGDVFPNTSLLSPVYGYITKKCQRVKEPYLDPISWHRGPFDVPTSNMLVDAGYWAFPF